MTVAYVDTSYLVAIAFDEPGAEDARRRLESADLLVASNLLEAEYRATFAREDVEFDDGALGWLRWVLPDRTLGPEMGRVLGRGCARGADLWHLSTALYVAPVPSELTFLTLDTRQRALATSLGFTV